jgi:hypothetical protein
MARVLCGVYLVFEEFRVGDREKSDAEVMKETLRI